MTDQHQSRAMRVQSSAIVLAAAITTTGAVTSALIQAVGIDKSPPAEVASLQPHAAAARPTFTASIQRPDGSLPKSRSTIAQAAQVSFHGPIGASASNTPASQPWYVAKPELSPGDAQTTLVSPWYYLSHSSSSDQSLAAAKPEKKSLDWGALTHLFQSHD